MITTIVIDGAAIVVQLIVGTAVFLVGKLYLFGIIIFLLLLSNLSQIFSSYFTYKKLWWFEEAFYGHVTPEYAIDQNQKDAKYAVSLQMFNFIFIGLAYWRFSVVYLISSKRFKNMIGRN